MKDRESPSLDPIECIWDSYRMETAQKILCEMVRGGYGPGREQHQAELAVKYTDCLINELKK